MADRGLSGQTSWEGEMFRLLVENVRDYAIFVVDGEGRVQSWNPGAERLLGYRADEVVGESAERFFTPEDVRDGVPQREMRQALEAGRGEDDRWHVRKDGSRFWSGGVMTPLRDQAGTLRGFAKIMRDRTDLKRTEEARERLRAGELRFRTLTSLAPVGIFQTDAAGNCLFVNEKWCRLAGMSAEAAAGQGWVRALHPDDRERVFHEWYTAAQAGREFASEYRFRTPEGKVSWLQGSAVALRDEAGEVVGHIGTITDLTERRNAEEQVRFHAHLLDSVGQAVVVTDPEGTIIYWNRHAESLYGWARGEAVGRHVLETVVAPGGAEQAAEVMGRLRAGESWSGEFPVRRRDGSTFPAFVTDTPIFDAGRLKAIIGVSADISRLKQVEDELREADRRKDEFLATLAHELRNPLAPIRNSLQILKLPRVDAEAVERSREMMERQVQQLVRLVDDLLDVSRVMRGKVELRKERVELAAVVARAVETVQPLLDAQRHELTISVPPESLALEADPVRLAQVVGNLLTNAAKYTEANGRIRLEAVREGGEAVLRVRDSGIGIAADLLPRVFDLFVQADHAATRSQGGLGIGLTLVKNLVEMHHGTVTARSEGPGQGSEFVVRLPLSRQAEERPAVKANARQGQARPASGHRLLVVDDNRDAADSLAMLLRLEGHEVRVAHDGPAALEMAKDYRPGLVFLDLGMPGMDGYEVARRLRRLPGLEGVRLAALTGWGQPADRRRSGEAGFDHHLVKPVEPRALEALLAGLKPAKG